MNIRSRNVFFILAFAVTAFLSSCKNEISQTTGWEYNNPNNGGFEVVPYVEQETGPGLILIQGGSFTMGRTQQDVMYEWNNIPRRVTVSSFYMDEVEVRNIDYLEYLYWIQRVFVDNPEVYKKSLPDTLAWRTELAFTEPYVELYLRHPAYRDYPVVGVSWNQANDYCNWRTDRVNEWILIREGILQMDPAQTNETNFNTEAYLAGQYEGMVKNDLPDMNPNGGGTRKVRMEDGIFLPKYRLPTEAEWEFASLGLIGNTVYENIIEQRMYPWNGHGVRNPSTQNQGNIMANFKRGRGDNMGIAGHLNDNADVTSSVYAYWPNDYGLYGMAGNVSEWVMDVYRPISFEDVNDFRPFRGNVFKTQVRDEEGAIAEKDSLGRIKWREVNDEQDNLKNRRNYRKADNINYLDGEWKHSMYYKDESMQEKPDKVMYESTGEKATSLINDKARVYKGGSWKDRTYYVGAYSRRFLDENQATDYIGFRCAMTRVGSPVGF